MEKKFKARCGTYCGACEWKERTNCKGCQDNMGELFWGTCKVAKCSIQRGFEHCGFCPELPCDLLRGAFDDPEHGDNGERLTNLKNWAEGIDEYLPLTPKKNDRD